MDKKLYIFGPADGWNIGGVIIIIARNWDEAVVLGESHDQEFNKKFLRSVFYQDQKDVPHLVVAGLWVLKEIFAIPHMEECRVVTYNYYA